MEQCYKMIFKEDDRTIPCSSSLNQDECAAAIPETLLSVRLGRVIARNEKHVRRRASATIGL